MKFKDTHLMKYVIEEHSFSFGDLYFLENIIVSEIHEGVLFDWEMVAIMIKCKEHFYGKTNENLYFLSNRTNNYAIIPQNWLKFQETYQCFKAYMVVTYRKTAITNVKIEQFFYDNSILCYGSLMEAFLYLNDKEHLSMVLEDSELVKIKSER
ncbi:hypothetical protein [Leeuwenhoekiella sp. NPDC079379]|uniref:hypothetical protein n=1 Tax=Leeuwenhoekiella sp. NPDC079379 TaxID=3364122 RepID=UPI0037C9FE42